jgi:S-adenosylmethionine hydrolase
VYGICPEARVVDLTHSIAPGDVAAAAFVLEAAASDFPTGTVHLAVVDPGVGTSRLALAAAAWGQQFVGPDNGVLEWALSDPKVRVHALEDERWFRLPVSRTFHGRDVFAPVAAHLAHGVPIDALGPVVASPRRLARPAPRMLPSRLEGRVAYVDRFGNALTNLMSESLLERFSNVESARLVVEIVGRRIEGISGSYGDARIGTLIAILGSSGRLEVAEVGGDAAKRFGIGVGDAVVVRNA